MEPYKILMIEDNAEIRKINRYVLADCGYEVLEAANLAEGGALLEKERPGLLILDGELPDGSGFDFCRELRKRSGIPVLFLSSLVSDADVNKGYAAGGNGYLTKPYLLDTMIGLVKTLLPPGGSDETRSGREGAGVNMEVRNEIVILNTQEINTGPA